METPRYRAKVRMYRQGWGDCFLITLPRGANGAPFFIMIDCGVMPEPAKRGDSSPTAEQAETMQRIVRDIHETTGGRIDLLIVTHAHLDHVSGFVQAQAEIEKITFGDVWLAWTEDRGDPQARALIEHRENGIRAPQLSVARLGLQGATNSAAAVSQFAGTFGSGEMTAAGALDVVRGLTNDVRYRRPSDEPFAAEGTSARIFVLGPPRDETSRRDAGAPAGDAGTYELALGLNAMLDPSTGRSIQESFAQGAAIPLDVAKTLPFFVQRYWGSPQSSSSTAPAWRLIDNAGIELAATELAFKLDTSTNNTSLVVAIELDGGDVLLFPGDAQSESWLTWPKLSWTLDGTTVTSEDLLRRCILYKAGQHGSNNGTLRAGGLDLMERLQTAMIPVDRATAVRKGWTRIPLPSLLERLGEQAALVLRADTDASAQANVTTTKDYHEVLL
jgi:beta-lactamase superfamily II metal-dependent hydrolase